MLISVAGNDPGPGVRAGLQADAEMAQRVGVHFRGVVAVETEQDEAGLRRVESRPAEEVEHQLREALMEAAMLGEVAIKTGALGTAEVVRAVARVAADWPEVPLVVDPVRQASRRHEGVPPLLDEQGWQCMQTELFPLAWLVTPNRAEYGEGSEFARARAVLVTGGEEDELADVVDLLIVDGEARERREARLPGAEHLHGTGCRHAAALAIGWMRFGELDAAVEFAAIPLRSWMAEQLGLADPRRD